MINEAQVFVAGYVATEPTFRTTSTGKPEAQMRVGYTPRRRDWESGEWSDGPSSFVSVKCWGRLASNVAVCLRKGEPVVVMGRVQVRAYKSKTGEDRLSVDVYANSIGYDLARGVARFSRTRPSTGETAAGRQPDGVTAGAPGGPLDGGPPYDDLDGGDQDSNALADLAYRRQAAAPEAAGETAPAPEETDGGGFFNDSALSTLAEKDGEQPSASSAPF